MSKHKSIPTATRKKLYEKYNHRCAYCGCELEYKDMQIDHVESVYRNNDIAQTMSEKEMDDKAPQQDYLQQKRVPDHCVSPS